MQLQVLQISLHLGRPAAAFDGGLTGLTGLTAFCLSCEVFASGVHHFCQHDRAFKEAGSFARRFLFDLLLVCLFLIQFLMIKDVLG